jgi:type I restriction enzyme S subunit
MNLVKLTEVCDFQGGTQPPKSEWIKDPKEGFIRMLQIRDFTQPERNNIEYIKSKSTVKTCVESDVLIGRYGASIGKICTGLSGAYNVALIKTIPNIRILDRNFLLYILKGYDFQNFISNIGSRAAQAGFNKADLENFIFPLPTLPQQQKIAAILDAADALRQNDKALIAKYDELTQALFLDMFGDPVSNPEGWEKAFLKSVSTKITDGTHFSPEPQTEGFPYITAKHVKSYGLDFYSKPTYVSEEAHNEIYKRCTPEYGDVLYIKDGATTGIACINTFDEPFSMLSSLALIKPKKDIINSYFLCFWLNNPNIKSKLLSEFMSGAAIQRYTLTKINSFELIVPPLTLQNQFAERITLIEEQKAIAQASLVKSEELFSSLLQKAFKGELV